MNSVNADVLFNYCIVRTLESTLTVCFWWHTFLSWQCISPALISLLKREKPKTRSFVPKLFLCSLYLSLYLIIIIHLYSIVEYRFLLGFPLNTCNKLKSRDLMCVHRGRTDHWTGDLITCKTRISFFFLSATTTHLFLSFFFLLIKHSKSTMEDNKTPEAPTPCTAGCGFYGNKIYNNMCSKCFKELDERNKTGNFA